MAYQLYLEIAKISNKTLKDLLCVMLKLFQEDKNLVFSKNILMKAIKTVTKHDLTLKIFSLIDGKIDSSHELSNMKTEKNNLFYG